MSKFFEKSQNLSKFLAKMEERISEAKIMDALLSEASADPENFKVGIAHIPGRDYASPVIVGEHAMSRGTKRLGLEAGSVLHSAIAALENPFVGTEVLRHPVIWDEEKDDTTAFEEDGIDSTVLIDADNRYTLVFEAGFNYILLKTVWDNAWGAFRTNEANVVIQIDHDKAITRRGGRIAAN